MFPSTVSLPGRYNYLSQPSTSQLPCVPSTPKTQATDSLNSSTDGSPMSLQSISTPSAFTSVRAASSSIPQWTANAQASFNVSEPARQVSSSVLQNQWATHVQSPVNFLQNQSIFTTQAPQVSENNILSKLLSGTSDLYALLGNPGLPATMRSAGVAPLASTFKVSRQKMKGAGNSRDAALPDPLMDILGCNTGCVSGKYYGEICEILWDFINCHKLTQKRVAELCGVRDKDISDIKLGSSRYKDLCVQYSLKVANETVTKENGIQPERLDRVIQWYLACAGNPENYGEFMALKKHRDGMLWYFLETGRKNVVPTKEPTHPFTIKLMRKEIDTNVHDIQNLQELSASLNRMDLASRAPAQAVGAPVQAVGGPAQIHQPANAAVVGAFGLQQNVVPAIIQAAAAAPLPPPPVQQQAQPAPVLTNPWAALLAHTLLGGVPIQQPASMFTFPQLPVNQFNVAGFQQAPALAQPAFPAFPVYANLFQHPFLHQ